VLGGPGPGLLSSGLGDGVGRGGGVGDGVGRGGGVGCGPEAAILYMFHPLPLLAIGPETLRQQRQPRLFTFLGFAGHMIKAVSQVASSNAAAAHCFGEANCLPRCLACFWHCIFLCTSVTVTSATLSESVSAEECFMICFFWYNIIGLLEVLLAHDPSSGGHGFESDEAIHNDALART